MRFAHIGFAFVVVAGCGSGSGSGSPLPLTAGGDQSMDGGGSHDAASPMTTTGEDCLDQLVQTHSPLLTDRGKLPLRNYDNQNVPFSPLSGYHLYTVEDAGLLVHKAHVPVYLRVYPQNGNPFGVHSFQNAQNGGWYAGTRLAAGHTTVLATTEDNRQGCPKATTSAVYTISIE